MYELRVDRFLEKHGVLANDYEKCREDLISLLTKVGELAFSTGQRRIIEAQLRKEQSE